MHETACGAFTAVINANRNHPDGEPTAFATACGTHVLPRLAVRRRTVVRPCLPRSWLRDVMMYQNPSCDWRADVSYTAPARTYMRPTAAAPGAAQQHDSDCTTTSTTPRNCVPLKHGASHERNDCTCKWHIRSPVTGGAAQLLVAWLLTCVDANASSC